MTISLVRYKPYDFLHKEFRWQVCQLFHQVSDAIGSIVDLPRLFLARHGNIQPSLETSMPT